MRDNFVRRSSSSSRRDSSDFRSQPPTLDDVGYDMAATALAMLSSPLFLLHPRLRGWFAERWGRVSLAPLPQGCQRVWLHGSSAGDIRALLGLREALAERSARLDFVCTAFTRSGREIAQQQVALPAAYLPLDTPLAQRRLIERIEPSLLVLEGLEIWPGLLRRCARAGVRVVVINGRMSAASLRHYRRWRVFRTAFERIELLFARTDADAERFAAIGVDRRRVLVESSTKHRMPAPISERPAQRVVFGSLHPNEERLLLPQLPRLLRSVPTASIAIAPRHPHRATMTMRQLKRLGIVARLAGDRANPSAQVEVVDQMGLLPSYYRNSQVAVVGGSFVGRLGGHDVLEPAGAGAAVIVGAHHLNHLAEVRQLVAARGGEVVENAADCIDRLVYMLERPQAARTTAQRGYQVACRFAGAASRVADRLAELLL